MTWLASGYLTNFLLIAVLVLIVINMGASNEGSRNNALRYEEMNDTLRGLREKFLDV